MIKYFDNNEKDLIRLLVLDILKQDKNYQEFITSLKTKNDD